MDVLGQVIAVVGCLLDKFTGLFGNALEIFYRDMVLRFRQERGGDIIEAFNLIEGWDAGRRRERETAGLAGKLQPVDALEYLFRRVGDLLRQWTGATQLVDNGLDD